MNVTPWLEFELAYCDAEVQDVDQLRLEESFF